MKCYISSLLTLTLACFVPAQAQAPQTKVFDPRTAKPVYDLKLTPDTKTIIIGDKDWNLYANYGNVKYFSGGTFVLRETGSHLFTFLSEDGQLLAKNVPWGQYSYEGPYFENGFCTDPERKAVMNNRGEILKTLGPNDKLGSIFRDGVTTLLKWDPKAEEWIFTFVDYNLQEVYPKICSRTKSDQITQPGRLRDDRRYFPDYEARLFGYINSEGDIVIPPSFIDVSDFSDGLAAVLKPGEDKWGFIDTEGNEVIPPTFTIFPGLFHHGAAVVEKQNGKKTFVFKSGEFWKDCTHLTPITDDGYFIMDYEHLIHLKDGYKCKLFGPFASYHEPSVQYDAGIPLFDGIYTSSLHPLFDAKYKPEYIGGGYLWICTSLCFDGKTWYEGGIAKYNGEMIVLFKRDDKNRF